jgi:hypothetical protein
MQLTIVNSNPDFSLLLVTLHLVLFISGYSLDNGIWFPTTTYFSLAWRIPPPPLSSGPSDHFPRGKAAEV